MIQDVSEIWRHLVFVEIAPTLQIVGEKPVNSIRPIFHCIIFKNLKTVNYLWKTTLITDCISESRSYVMKNKFSNWLVSQNVITQDLVSETEKLPSKMIVLCYTNILWVQSLCN
jgi:hypothetical protein